MKCDEIKALLDEFVEGDLESPQKETVEKHLEGCPSCREEASALRRTIRLMAEFGEVDEPSDFLQRVRKRLESPAKRSFLARLTERPLIARAIASVGCLTIVAVAAWFAYRQLSPAPPAPTAERKPQRPPKPEVVALVRGKSEREPAKAGRELRFREVREQEKAPSRATLGKGASPTRDAAAPSVSRDGDWGELDGKADRDAASRSWYTDGQADDAAVALNKKAVETLHDAERPVGGERQPLLPGEETALKEETTEAEAVLSQELAVQQMEEFSPQGGRAYLMPAPEGDAARGGLDPTVLGRIRAAGQPAAAMPAARPAGTQDRTTGTQVEGLPSSKFTPIASNADLTTAGASSPQAPAPPLDYKENADRYHFLRRQEEGLLAGEEKRATTDAVDAEFVRPNRPQLGEQLEDLRDQPDIAQTGLRYGDVADYGAGVSGLARLPGPEDEGGAGDVIPLFLVSAQNPRKTLDEISRFVVESGGEAKIISRQPTVLRGNAVREDNGLLITLPRAVYEEFYDKFRLRPAARGQLGLGYEVGGIEQVQRRRGQVQETVTFILRVIKSSPAQPSKEAGR